MHGQGQRITGVLLPACDEAAAREELEAAYGPLRVCRAERFTPGREVIPTLGKCEKNPGTGITSADADALVLAADPMDAATTPWRADRPPDG